MLKHLQGGERAHVPRHFMQIKSVCWREKIAKIFAKLSYDIKVMVIKERNEFHLINAYKNGQDGFVD